MERRANAYNENDDKDDPELVQIEEQAQQRQRSLKRIRRQTLASQSVSPKPDRRGALPPTPVSALAIGNGYYFSAIDI